MNKDELYINRCLQLAKNALGTARPNPMVGAVIVLDNKVIGEGFTSPYGGPHAEVNAINAVKDKTLLPKATLYVTLEPCSHYGQTPPCSDLIIKHRIPRVIIGCLDDNPKVAGKGIKKLKSAGCEVTVGVLEEQCKKHHKRFLTYINKKRPYVILKWAVSQDGFMAPSQKKERKPVWITNDYSRQLVHKWRSKEQAILVGTSTVLEDNPSLTVRDWMGANPIRFVLGKTSLKNEALRVNDGSAPTVFLNENSINFNEPVARQVCDYLFNLNISSVIVEGGAKTLNNFIKEGLWDEAWVFTGNKNLNSGVRAPQLEASQVAEETILNDTLVIYERD